MIGVTPSRRARLTSARALSFFLMLALVSCGRRNSSEPGPSTRSLTPNVVRIVRTKQLQALAVMEKKGSLEARLKPMGVSVEWLEFAAGPQQLEALAAGALDIALTAESPPVFAQAAGAPLVYFATTATDGRAVSLLVPAQSPVHSIADLKGKTVAFQKASIGHYLLVRALEHAGMKLGDVVSVFLPPPDANVAFSESKVDAWFIWEPYATRAVESRVGRVLLDGEQLKDCGSFYTTSRAFAEARPDVLRIFLDELQAAEAWSRDHRHEMAELLSPSLLIDVPTLEQMHAKYTFVVFPIDEQVVERQQKVADMWFDLGFLPARVNVRDGVLPWDRYAALTPKSVSAGP
jgi:sulfonate transport system substrate-binding protein